jgi:hypothetical protein
MQTKQCKDCVHASLRFNGGNGATTCNLLNEYIVIHGHHQDKTPDICPLLPEPKSRNGHTVCAKPTAINAENFSDVVSYDKIYTSKCISDDHCVNQNKQPPWKLSKVVSTEDDGTVIFEVKTVEEIPRRITMASHGEGWHREVMEVEFELQQSWIDKYLDDEE